MKLRVGLFRAFQAALLSLPLFSELAAQQSGIPPNDIERVGQSGWQFLKINGDARQAAMGGAFTAFARGNASAVFGNPAALVEIRRFDVQLNSMSWIADINHYSAAFAANLGDWGTVALSLVTLDYGDIPETINVPIPENNITEVVITGSQFSARDIAAGVSYARRITDRLSVGGNVRWLRQSIAEVSMTNISLDFGTLYYTGLKTLRIAITARNFGPDSHLVGFSEEFQAEPVDVRMPIDFRLGLAYDLLEERSGSPHFLTAAIEGNHPNDGPEKIQMGMEYSFYKKLFLRGGYKFNHDEQGLTLGAGFSYSSGGFSGTLNYAYVEFGALKQVHVFSFGFSF
jgi:hypothetical protein